MKDIKVLGIDLAKDVFQMHGVNALGKQVFKKRIERDKLAEYIANIPQCTIAMEACGGSNYWARVFQREGHHVKLISPQFVSHLLRLIKMEFITLEPQEACLSSTI